MTTEKYLGRMYWLLNTIESKTEVKRLERSKAINLVAPTDGDRVQTSAKDRLGEILSRVVDIDNEIQDYVDEYLEIKAQVDTLSGNLAPAYVYRRYAMNQSMNEITEGLHVSRSTAYRIRDNALSEFEKKYGKTYKRVKGF
jgi:hypothetical protein